MTEQSGTWKMSSPTAILTAVLAAFMLFLSVRALLDPLGAAAGYGIPLSARGDIPWIYVKAGRDLGVAAALAALLLARQRRAVGIFVLAATLMPLSDFLVVTSQTGRVAFALGVHGSATVYTFALGVVLLRRSSPRRVATTQVIQDAAR